MAIQRAWHRDGRRLVRSVRDRAVRVDPAKPPRPLAFDDVRAWCGFGDDAPSLLRTARESLGTFKGRRRAPASKQQGCAARSISHSGLLAAHDWFLCVRFPCDIYRFAPPILHLRQLRRPVVLWAADIRD